MAFVFQPRRCIFLDISEELKKAAKPLSEDEVKNFETFDFIYRALCALMYNYVPMSGHPGGSISSGRFVASILFDAMNYDMSDPERQDADMISYAAGHKALGLYGLWAMRNEVARIGAKDLLPGETKFQLRLEDLLGFRRNPVATTPLFLKYNAKPLDGHPTPATPFIKLSTGASGVGVATSLGLGFAAMDFYGKKFPRLHIVEGEGGMTPGRVYEAMAAAGTACLKNTIMHIDWNQASIDSNHVCRDGDTPGDYVQWSPMEVAYLHDWNVILVPDGRDFQQIIAAQRKAASINNSQPTAIVYKTTKGWKYGIEGRASHGAGHKLCSEDFYKVVEPLLEMTKKKLQDCEPDCKLCKNGKDENKLEECYWEGLLIVRAAIEQNQAMTGYLSGKLKSARDRLDKLNRKPRENAPNVDLVYETAASEGGAIPESLRLAPGASTTLRGELGRVLNYYNKKSDGSLLAAAADLLGSTSVNKVGDGFPGGYYNAEGNPGSRILSIGGICEDAMCGVLSGMASYGRHIGVGSSYGAFIAALGHISSRLHGIGNQAHHELTGDPYRPFFLVCAHAGLKTGEDGPTHADPQPLQLLQENFPKGTAITLTPWDPQEIWTLVSAALVKRPAVIAPFVTRPNETVVDRAALGLAGPAAANTGVYLLKEAEGKSEGTIVIQGSEVAYAFIEEALPLLKKEGIDVNVYYVSSAELFDLLSPEEQKKVFPVEHSQEAMGITGFTLPTMYRWIRSERGRSMTVHAFQKGHFLGSGKAEKVMLEAGLDGESQFKAIVRYVKER